MQIVKYVSVYFRMCSTDVSRVNNYYSFRATLAHTETWTVTHSASRPHVCSVVFVVAVHLLLSCTLENQLRCAQVQRMLPWQQLEESLILS